MHIYDKNYVKSQAKTRSKYIHKKYLCWGSELQMI